MWTLNTRKNPYMFRLDLAHHVVRTVQGVTESVLEGSIMQTFNHTWGKKEERYLKLWYLIVCLCAQQGKQRPTYLGILCSLGLVEHQSGCEVWHLPRPELLGCCHVDQIFHHRVAAVTQWREEKATRSWNPAVIPHHTAPSIHPG